MTSPSLSDRQLLACRVPGGWADSGSLIECRLDTLNTDSGFYPSSLILYMLPTRLYCPRNLSQLHSAYRPHQFNTDYQAAITMEAEGPLGLASSPGPHDRSSIRCRWTGRHERGDLKFVGVLRITGRYDVQTQLALSRRYGYAILS